MKLLQRTAAPVLVLFSFAAAQSWNSVFSLTTASAKISSMVCTPASEIYIGGHCYDSLALFDTIFTSNGRTDCFILKIDTIGTLSTAIGFGGTAIDYLKDMELRENNHVIVTGTFQESMSIGTTTVEAPASESFYLADFAEDGSLAWIAVSNALSGVDVCCLENGMIAVTGLLTDSAQFAPGEPLAHHGKQDIFLAVYSSDGEMLWASSIGSSGDDQVTCLRSYNNEIYLGGYHLDTLYAGNDTIVPESGFEQSFLLAFDTLGTLFSISSLVSDGKAQLNASAFDADGNMYLLGNFTGTLHVDTFSLLADDETALFLIKLLPDGICDWIQQAGFAYGNDIAVLDSIGIFIVGSYKKKTLIDTFELEAGDIENLVTAHFTPDGKCDWIMQAAGGCRATYAQAVAVNQTHMIITGDVQPNRVSKDCVLEFGSCVATYESWAVGHGFIALCNYTAETGVTLPFAGYRGQGHGTAPAARFFDLKGRAISQATAMPGKRLPGGTPAHATQVIVKDAGKSKHQTVNTR